MKQQKKVLVKFAPRGKDSFYEEVKRKVDEYFKSNNITEHANRAMRIKTIAMLSMYFVPYLLMVTGLMASSLWLYFGAWTLMGLGVVGIGASVMHDCNHGSYSNNKFVNKMLGNIIHAIGGYGVNWRIQHNILHHTYTNVEGLDEDIDPGVLLRFSPNSKRLGIHRFQHIYAWFLYSLMNLHWVTGKDYILVFRYHKQDLLKKQKRTLKTALIELTAIKVVYYIVFLVLPILFSGVSWGIALTGFILMHVIGGLALACIFQPAHVMETSEYNNPSDDRKMENSWAVHQLLNTTNFSPNSKITSWFIGGLNYQIEHHLFPNICHIHYPKLSKIVKSVAEEHNIPYHVQPTFASALWEHGKMLKVLGQPEKKTA